MTKATLRRWGRRSLLGSAVGVLALPIAWALLVHLVERADTDIGLASPSVCSTADPRYAAAIATARAHARALLAERDIPGLAVAVAVGREVVWSEAFGYADLENKAPATPTTRFRAASLSKPLTAAALARLVEQGRLDLDAPVLRYVPSFPDKGHPLTCRQLASHRAGVRAYRDDAEALNTKHYASVTASLEKFQDDPLLFEPDTGFSYSGYGYVLLSAAIEGAARKDFLAVVRDEVCGPLGMAHTGPDLPRGDVPGRSTFYDVVTPYSPDGRRVVAPYIDFSCKWAAGGFLSTAEDLARFGAAHAAPDAGFLRPGTLELLFAQRTRQAGLVGYGLGWMTARDLHLRRVGFHFGAGSGGTAVLAVYPGQRVSVALMANLGHARFPMGRLLNVAHPFLADPARGLLGAYLALLVGGAFAAVLFRLRRWGPRARRNAHRVG